MSSAPPALAPGVPSLDWDGAIPRAADFEDIYFSPEDGLAESEAVFLEGCGLPEAWAGRSSFTVGELGFGTGLNVLALLRLWKRARPKGGRLHIVSVEGFPMTREDAARALAAFPQLAGEAETLLAAWPPRIKGVHRRALGNGVTLTLAFLEAREALGALDLVADAWFLDGFAPAKNAAMWSPEIFAAVAARTRPGARAATFTVAGEVRRSLQAAGFAVEKKPGYGRKRERLEAVYQGPPPVPLASPLYPRTQTTAGRVLILGGGVAGACVARALRSRGVETRLLDAGAGPGAGASGMPAGLVAPRLDLDDTPVARFHRTAYAAALDAYGASPAFRAIGVLRAGKDEKEAQRLARLLEARALPADMALPATARDAGADSDASGILLPQAGLLDPRAFVGEALDGTRCSWTARVDRVEREGDAWVARDAHGARLGEGVACVLALGASLPRIAQASALPIRPSRGQITLAPLAGPAPSRALVWGGYAAPLGDGRLLFGATHDDIDADTPVAPDSADDARNLATLAAFASGIGARIDANRLEGHAAARATTPDRLPYLGAVPDADLFRDRFAGLSAGRIDPGPPADLHPGLYVLGGLGSRGFAWAPALAEALAAEMLGEPGALEIEAAAALHPARMLVRSMKRRSS